MDGIINLNKPPGITSFKAVDIIRRLTGIKKVGHAGTLDPSASGVLIICLGSYCKRSDQIMASDKEYEAEITFGTATDSGDSDGKITEQKEVSVEPGPLRKAISSLTGQIEQIPPMVSAIHHKGKRLYELARKGITVERAPRKVTINSIDLLSFDDGPNPKARIRVSCSKGTYIRTLCEDIGKALGVPAHESVLVRTRSGKFDLSKSITLEELKSLYNSGELEKVIIRDI